MNEKKYFTGPIDDDRFLKKGIETFVRKQIETFKFEVF